MTKKINPMISKSEALKLTWKNRKNYIGEIKNTSLYNNWRSRVFTKKGKNIGFPEQWKTFQGFQKDIPDGWSEGLILTRKNNKLPYSKNNCEWVEKGMECLGRLTKFEYNGKSQTLLEWAKELGVSYNGVRQRYYKGKNYTKEQILYGKFCKIPSTIKDIKELDDQNKKDKISKMISAYRIKDKKRNRIFNLSREYFENNIISKPCYYCGSLENIGCDRIDNSKGHTEDNVIPACYTCNVVRNNHFSIEEMKQIGSVIAKIMDERNGKS
jgi:hypothetical protein